jgi:predicted DNA-binding transcriptional regulator YafY
MVIRLCLMARSTKTQKSLKLNAAHRLLSRGTDMAGAADILSREFGISPRQAYRYLKDARAIGRAIPVAEPSVPATFKIPSDVLRQLRAYSAVSGLTLSAILTRAVKSYLTLASRQRRKNG